MDQLTRDAIKSLIWNTHLMFDQTEEPWTKNRCQNMLMEFKIQFPDIYDSVANQYLKAIGI